MIRKPYMHTFAAVLAALGVLVGTVHYEKGGLARAEGATQLKVGGDRTPDLRSQVLAGRLVRVVDGNATPCERGQTAADANVLHATIEAQLAHMARLAAEYRGLDEIAVPPELQSHQNDPQFVAALRDERMAFVERKEALASQITALNEAKDLEQREVEYTQAKEAAFARQDALLQKELSNVNGLMDKGLAVASQKLALEQSVLQSEANRLDLKLLILKAQQEVSKSERNITDLRSQWRSEALTEFNKAQQELNASSQQAQANGGADPASTWKAGNSCEDSKESFYLIARGPGGILQAFPVAAKN